MLAEQRSLQRKAAREDGGIQTLRICVLTWEQVRDEYRTL